VKVKYRWTHLINRRKTVDILLIIGIVLLLVALLGMGGVIEALGSIAWVLLIIAVIVIAWRVITGRRPV
jgi:purine-cytosine permease-like protein